MSDVTGYEMLGKWRALPTTLGQRRKVGRECAAELQPFLESLSAEVEKMKDAAAANLGWRYGTACQECADAIERIVGSRT